ncbi:MAG: PilZ domain-containing protein [Desulfoarculaceae bacterium]|nr:PilZ domain-containing protein [Desulfoarculaceae bacterium]
MTDTYTMQAPSVGDDHMEVTNISGGGLQFTIPDSHALKIGQEVQVTFTLDDRQQTEISKGVIVHSVTGNIIGCRFAGNEPLEQGLRFYLFP